MCNSFPFYYLNSPILLPKLLFSSPFLSHNPGLLPGTLVWPTLHCFDSFLFGPASLWCGCVYVCTLERKRKQQWSYFSICEVFILSEEMLGFWVWIHGFPKMGTSLDVSRCNSVGIYSYLPMWFLHEKCLWVSVSSSFGFMVCLEHTVYL